MSHRPSFNAIVSPWIACAIRVLIASYFLASVGLVEGHATGEFMETVLPEGPAKTVAAGILYVTSFSIMIGWFIRPAALILALFVFWTSFVPWINAGSMVSLDDFWRDMVMVGSLVLIATTQVGLKPQLRRRKVAPRRVAFGKIRTLRPRTQSAVDRSHGRASLPASPDWDDTEPRNMFA